MNKHLILLNHSRDAAWFGYQFKEYYAYVPSTKQLTHCLVVDFVPGQLPTAVVKKPIQLVSFLNGMLLNHETLQLYTSIEPTTPESPDWRWELQLTQLPASLQEQVQACSALIQHCEEVLARELLYVEIEIKALKATRLLAYEEIDRNMRERDHCRREIVHQLDRLQAEWIMLLTQERISV